MRLTISGWLWRATLVLGVLVYLVFALSVCCLCLCIAWLGVVCLVGLFPCGVGIIYSFARYLACWWWGVALVGLWVGALGVLGFLYGGGCFG